MNRYAPVRTCSQVIVQGTTVSGLAYPAEGPRCCAIELVAGGSVIGAVRADRYAEGAAARHIRDGWCGFRHRLHPNDFISDDDLALRCARSREVLHVVHYAAVDWRQETSEFDLRRPITVTDLLTPDRGGAGNSLRAYEPLTRRLAATLDAGAFVTFAFRFLLGRDPDLDGRRVYLEGLLETNDHLGLLETIAASDEHAKKRRGWLPSPFDEQFPAVPVFLPTHADAALPERDANSQ